MLNESSVFREIIGSALPTVNYNFSLVGWSRRNRIPKAGAFGQRLRRYTKTPAKLHESSGFRDLILSALPTFNYNFSLVGRSRRNRIPKAGAFGKRLRRFMKASEMLHENSGFREIIPSALPTTPVMAFVFPDFQLINPNKLTFAPLKKRNSVAISYDQCKKYNPRLWQKGIV
jgi:hypothetical protein